MNDILDPLIQSGDKAFPLTSAALRCSAIGKQGWNILQGHLSFPVAVIKQEALRDNLAWMQAFAREHGLELAPHGKTTMSPKLFAWQLAAGAWGITVANLAQLAVAVASGARRCIIANQVMDPLDLAGIEQLQRVDPALQIYFLCDSVRQIEIIEAYSPRVPLEVLLEIGVPGARTGVRSEQEALSLAQRIHESRALSLGGIECYEGLGATGDDSKDTQYVQALVNRVHAVAKHCDQHNWYGSDEVIITAGGSVMFDLVAKSISPKLSRKVVGVLRSGCYVTHDDGMYARMGNAIGRRMGCAIGLHAAIEVWGTVQSRPEAGLAILNIGKRDISHDIEMPRPVRWCTREGKGIVPAPSSWSVSGLNDQHAYLRIGDDQQIEVGDRVALGISHPCTTFDKWSWLAIVDSKYDVVDAVTTVF